MSVWPSVRIAELCELRPQKAEARRKLRSSDRVSFVPMNDLPVDEMWLEAQDDRALADVEGSYTYFADGDVLLAKITPCFENGKLGIARGLMNGIGFGSSEFFVLRPSERLLPQYLYYYLSQSSYRDQGSAVMTGAVGHRRVPKEFIEETMLPLPSLGEQKRVVTILDEAFEGIAKATANAERNLANARDLFAGILRNSFADQAGWKPFNLGDRVRFIDYRGKTPPKTETGVRLITAKNVKMGFIQRTPEEFIDPEAYDGWMTRGFPRLGDVLFTTEAPLGNVAQLDTDEMVVIGQRLITMQSEGDFIQSDFLKWLLMSPQTQATIWKLATGATVQGIKARLLKTISLFVPDEIVQGTLSDRLENAWQGSEALAVKYQEKADQLTVLKSALLHKAFSGQLTGKEAIAA